jgi:hypothetical protein
MKKRKLVDSAQHLSRLNNNKVPSSGSVLAKKRKKFSLESGGDGVVKPSGDGEYAGTQDLSNQEKFLQETKAALKSLSGSWPVAPDDRYEKPNFENLFEENGKKFLLTPQQVATSKSSKAANNSAKAADANNCASIKDVVTLSSSSNAPNDEPTSPQPSPPEQEEDVDVVKPVADPKPDDDDAQKKDAEEEAQPEVRKNDNPIDNLLKIETECEKIPSKVEDKKQYFFNNQMLMPAAYAAFDDVPNEKIVDVPSSPSSGKRYTVLQPASADSKAASQIQDIAKIGLNVIQPSKENAADVDKVKTGEEPPLSPDNPANARGRHIIQQQ